MNKEIVIAMIKQCENVIKICSVDIQTREREISELYELRKQYEGIEIETEYCINSSRSILLNNFPTCQNPRFLLSSYQEMERLFFEDDSESVLGKFQETIEKINEEINIRQLRINRLSDDISNERCRIYEYEKHLSTFSEEK